MSGKFDRRKNFTRGGGGGNRPPWRPRDSESEEVPSESRVTVQDEQTLRVLQMFGEFQRELDARYDKVERIVKKSRDITIESKRVIFLLHRISKDKEEVKDSIFEDASYRLRELCNTSFRGIALELQGEDPYQFIRPYSPGLQEFIEAALYYKFLKDDYLLNYQEIQDHLVFEKVKTEEAPAATTEGATVTADTCATTTTESMIVYVPPTEYLLGMADFTGELMRKCINSLGSGEQRVAFEGLPHLRRILEGFQRVGPVAGAREMSTKLHVLRQSVEKVENACYAMVVRRTEVPDYKLPNLGLLTAHVGLSSVEVADEVPCDNF